MGCGSSSRVVAISEGNSTMDGESVESPSSASPTKGNVDGEDQEAKTKAGKQRSQKENKEKRKKEKGEKRVKTVLLKEETFIQGFDEEEKSGTLVSKQKSGAAAAPAAAATDHADATLEKEKKKIAVGPKTFLGPAKGQKISFDLDDEDDHIETVSGSNDMIESAIQELAEDDDDYGDFDPSKFKVANSTKRNGACKIGFLEEETDTGVLIVGDEDTRRGEERTSQKKKRNRDL